MKKYVFMLVLLLAYPLYAFNTITNVNINKSSTVVKDGSYIKVSVRCSNNSCDIDKTAINKARLIAIANIKSVKSWSRDFENGDGVKYLKTVRISNTECVITFIICHSSDSKMFDNTFGIEILYKEK